MGDELDRYVICDIECTLGEGGSRTHSVSSGKSSGGGTEGS